MVKGLEKFRTYFRDFAENYVIIGGTACNELLADKDPVRRSVPLRRG
ncbi:MAG: hypothetical protein LBR10_04930 [Prevotellaceae bacterium]|jgi:hypothetical protein|nr:hypothetical protein [Prevotellaceae bacterium]